MLKLYDLFVEGKRWIMDEENNYCRELDEDIDFINFAREKNLPISKTFREEITLKDLSEKERNSLTSSELKQLGG